MHRQTSSISKETEESVSPSVTLLRRTASYFRILTAIIICLVLITMLFGTLDSAHFRSLSHEAYLINQHHKLQKQTQEQEQEQKQGQSQLQQLQQKHNHQDWNEKESAIVSYQSAMPNTLNSLDFNENPKNKHEQSITSASTGTPISYDITHGFCSAADICFSSQFHDGVDRQHGPSTKLKNSHHLKLFK